MKRSVFFLTLFLMICFCIPSFADDWHVLEKASPDECFHGVGSDNNLYPFDPNSASCDGREKRNEAYVWGLTKYGNNIFFGTGANIHCLVIRGYLGQDDPILNEDYVCEASANDPWGDLRPPSLYMYNSTNGLVKLFDLNYPPASPPALYSEAAGKRFASTGIRSAGAHPDGVVFLAGPSISPRGVNLFAFNGNTGQLLGSHTRTDYTNIRKWIVGSDGELYLGFGGGEGGVGGGAVWKWTGDPDAILGGDAATLFDFEIVGNGLDGDAAEMTEHNNRLFVNTWPGNGGVAGLWMSPPLPLSETDSVQWQKVWQANQYDPDPITAQTYGGGAVASFDGWVYWGTMHVPGTAALAHAQVYGAPANDDAQTDLMIGTWRAISIFRGKGFETGNPDIQLLYGGSLNNNSPGYFQAYNPSRQTWETRKNLMGLTPLYGRGGFNNQFNNYCWTMRVYHGQLYVGTMDHSYLVNDIFEDPNLLSFFYIMIYFGSYDYGADLFKFTNGSSSAQAVSRDGMGNIMNYGIRTMITDASNLYLGSANPMNLNTNGGWELIRLNTQSTRVPDVMNMNQAGAQRMIAQADLDCDTPNITYVCSENIANGMIIDQAPAPGLTVSPGSDVFLTVSTGSCPPVPSPPTGMDASDGTFSDKVQVTWNASEGATFYNVYRSDMKALALAERIKVATQITETIFEDTSAESGSRYFYWVKAANSTGISPFSIYDTGYWGPVGTRPDLPTNVNATDGTFADRVRITWNAVPDTLIYEIWRSDIPIPLGGKMKRVGIAETTSYDDFTVENGTRYYYCVKARNSWGVIKSKFNTGYIGSKSSPPPAPSGLTASDGTFSGKVNVTWDAVSGAEIYEIWRDTKSVEDGGNPQRIGFLSDTSFDDTTADEATTYYYWVKSRDSWGSSKYSVPDTGYY